MRSKGNNIVFLIPGFPKDETDTNCIPILQNYILYYKKYNPDKNVTVIAFQYPFERKKYKWNNIDVYCAGGKNRKGIWRFFTWLIVFIFFLRIHFKLKTSVIHSFWLTECSFLGQIMSALFRIKHISTIVGQDCLSSNKYLSFLNFKGMNVVALSTFAATKFYESTNNKVKSVISIGLDVERFIYVPSSIPSIDILGVGNLHKIKNFTLFINVIEELREMFPTIRCRIIGNGGEYNLLTELINNKQLQSNIELVGELPREKVLEAMSNSYILLHTSTHEGQGYVFEEALYSGMTIVAMKVGNLNSSERIRLCENKNEMLDSLKHLLVKPNTRERIILSSMEESVRSYNKLYFDSKIEI